MTKEKKIKIILNGKLVRKYPSQDYVLAIEYAKDLAGRDYYKDAFVNEVKVICPLPEDFRAYGTEGTN